VAWLAVVLLLVTVAVAAEAIFGGRQLERLAKLPPRSPVGAPRLSIVVAARDEERGIETAVRSMLGQDYPDYEIVVVDDRSTDGTGAILDRLAATEPRLTVVHVTSLPPGWLGKNHALHLGAQRATGEWLLFTDADIHLEDRVLGRAVRYCEDRGIDHLASSPEVVMPGLLLQGFGVFFLYSFLTFAKPWKAKNPKSWFFIGVGAFNLVRRAAYLAVGGHQPIRLRPDDDMKLGKILKRGGFRQDAVNGQGAVRVEWYHSLGELVRGLEKNMFSGVEYSISLSLFGGAFQLLVGVFPIVAMFLTDGTAQLVYAAQLSIGLVTMGLMARSVAVSPMVALITPVVVGLFVYILWRTMAVNLINGGIRWRGTFYSLRELKGNRV
jgi:glycosyltransferase involved in cell wall biosynthesis